MMVLAFLSLFSHSTKLLMVWHLLLTLYSNFFCLQVTFASWISKEFISYKLGDYKCESLWAYNMLTY
jgi:hypothetical protein